MAGLKKMKEYDWKDSNMALVGSDTDRKVKKESAETEAAWRGAGAAVGIQIWRIVKFKVTHWPKEDYGKFYNGDSYIILNTYQEEGGEELLYDVHFWIGKNSTQDEYGTAAYKTVELDTLLDDKPVQHREVEGYESSLFKSYFKHFETMEGGADTGFRKVSPTQYTPRLLHFHGDRKGVVVKEVPKSLSSLDSTDVFILDLGLNLIQWNGSESNKDERFRAGQYMQQIANERNGRPKKETVDQGRDTEEFESHLTEAPPAPDTLVTSEAQDTEKELYRLSDESGKMKIDQVKKGKVAMGDLESKDVFILDTKAELFVWIGKKTSFAEQSNAMSYAHNYLMKTDHPLIPVCCINEGRKNKAFSMAIAA